MNYGRTLILLVLQKNSEIIFKFQIYIKYKKGNLSKENCESILKV